MLRHHRLRAVLVATAVGAATAVAGPATAADSVFTWRPGTTPASTGFWSNKCADGAPSSGSLNSDDAGITDITKPTVVAGSGSESAWQFPTTATTEVGPSATVGDDLTGASIAVKGPASGTITGRLVIRYVKSALLVKYVRYATAPITLSSGWNTYTATGTTSMSVYGNTLSSTASVGTKSLSWVAGDLDTGTTATMAIEVGCNATPVAMDHFKVTTSSGTTDYDMTNALSTSALTSASSTRTPVSGQCTNVAVPAWGRKPPNESSA